MKAFLQIITFTVLVPSFLVTCFKYQVVNETSRQPAVIKEHKVKRINTVKENVFNYLITVK